MNVAAPAKKSNISPIEDVQGRADTRCIPINKVGIKDIYHPVKVKDRARFASRNPKVSPEKRAVKEEMVQWMLVWLENPEVFPAWVRARKLAPSGQNRSAPADTPPD